MNPEVNYPLKIEAIREYLPHRTPFLLVDRILEVQLNKNPGEPVTPSDMVGNTVIGIKNVTYNEPYMQGHFPSFSIVPGVLLIESMAQVSSFALYPYACLDFERFTRSFKCILMGISQVKFRQPVVPGDTVRMESKVSKCRGKIWSFECQALVDGKRVCEAEILANVESDVNVFEG